LYILPPVATSCKRTVFVDSLYLSNAQIVTQETSELSDVKKLLKKHDKLNQLDMAKVVSHIQRDSGDWVINTIMLEGYDVPFKYGRKTAYKSLQGARVNLTYYAETKTVGGLNFETMNVVRIRRS
jgi:hypothetical protein